MTLNGRHADPPLTDAQKRNRLKLIKERHAAWKKQEADLDAMLARITGGGSEIDAQFDDDLEEIEGKSE